MHRHRATLSQPVAPVLRLPVNLRVKVAVVDDHGVRARQVKPLATRARAQQKTENLRTRLIIRVANLLPLVNVRAAVQSHEPVSLLPQHPLQDVQHDLPLAEDQRPRALGLDRGQQVDERRCLGGAREGGGRKAQVGQMPLFTAELV